MTQTAAPRRAITRDAAAPLENTQYSRAGLVAGNVLLFGPLALIFAPQLLGVLAAVATLAAAPWRAVARRGTPALHSWLIAAFALWGCVRLFWGGLPKREFAFESLSIIAIVLLGLTVGGDVRRGADRALVTRAAIAGITTASAILAIGVYAGLAVLGQFSSQAEVVGNDPTLKPDAILSGFVAISAMLPLVFTGAGICLRIGPWGWIAAGAGTLAMLGLSILVGHWLGVAAWIVGAATLAAGCFRPERAFSATALIGACVIALSPWWLAPFAGWMLQGFGASLSADTAFAWVARVQSWAFTSDLVGQKALLGWGPGAATTFEETHLLRGYPIPYIDGHPHSAALQLWLEMGGVGVALACGALAALGRRNGAALAKDMFAAAAATSAMGTGLLLLCMDAGLWNPSLWTALSLSAVMTRLFRDAS